MTCTISLSDYRNDKYCVVTNIDGVNAIFDAYCDAEKIFAWSTKVSSVVMQTEIRIKLDDVGNTGKRPTFVTVDRGSHIVSISVLNYDGSICLRTSDFNPDLWMDRIAERIKNDRG